MLTSTESDFDVLCFTKTKIKEGSDIVNIDIPGYTCFHTPTKTNFGGTFSLVKNQFSPKLLPEFSQSAEKSFNSTFIEIKNDKNKSLVIGTIYRHPKADDSFINSFLTPTLIKLGKMKKKVALAGDFNFDLLKYETHKPTNEFYDILSSYSYRPCILQPSRVTYKLNTLVNNIFINDFSCNLEKKFCKVVRYFIC